MKKLVFLFAMVFVVSMAMGQKTSWITQAGVGNEADVEQQACLSEASASIIAVQSGSYNTLTTEQHGPDNYLGLTQTGEYNTAQMTEQFICHGAGGINDAEIYQAGHHNLADLLQQGTGSLSNAYVKSEQYGNNNTLSVKQNIGGFQYANSLQNGANNLTDITQVANINTFSDNEQQVISNQYGADVINVKQIDEE